MAAYIIKHIDPAYLWCFILIIGRVWAEVPPPTIKEGRHVSLNAIRVEWDVTLSAGNGSDDITSFTVGLSTDNCTHFAQRKDVSDIKFKTWTFYGVDSETNAACVQSVTSNGTSSWASIKIKNEENRPPSIVEGPADSKKIYYFSPSEGEYKILTCDVKGRPKPNVTWTVGGKIIKSGSNGYTILPNDSLSIDSLEERHQGAYSCTATNSYGKAASDSIVLKMAVLHTFPHDEVRNVPIEAGRSLVLPCRLRPHSVPEGGISWLKAVDDTDYIDVRPNHKIAIGPQGELIFMYVVAGDAGLYKCEVWNNQLDQGVDGSASLIKVLDGDTFGVIQPALLVKSAQSILAYEGEEARITCVFSGSPAPDIIWKKAIGLLDPHRHHTIDYNRTLVLRDVKPEDAGNYECEGSTVEKNTNKRVHSPPVTIKLIVQARPKWIERPQPVNATVGDDVTFRCRAGGNPLPTIQWYINGEPFQGQETSKFLRQGDDLVIQGVTKKDMMNVQCNASSNSGYLYANAYLNVVFPTRIVDPPKNVTLTPGGVMTFPCVVESDPGTPITVMWYRGKKPIIAEHGRIHVTPDNSLVINTTNEEDGGRSFVASYTCVVTNGVHNVTATAKLRPNGGGSGPQIRMRASREYELSLIGVCGALVSVVVIGVVLLLIYRRRQQTLMKRSGTETSNLTYLSSNSHQDDEITRLPCEDSDFPLLPYLDDDILKNKIKEVLILRTKIELGRTLGKGQFGRVYEGILRDNRGKVSNRVAVKTLKYKPEETEIVELFLREAVMMKDFWHAHVLSLIGISVDEDGSPMVILPLMENSDLRIYVQDPEKEITVLELLQLGHQVAQGMVYLSNMRFIHRDLAARNCMVDINRIVKVADFGLSRDLFSRDYYRIEDGKTPLPVRWMAPESLSKSIFTTLSDVWSYGVLLWELMTRGAVPYPDIDNWDIAHYIQTGKRLAQPVYCPDSIYNIMLACWEEEPENRPTFERIVKDIDVIIDSARSLPKASSHLYLNIHSKATVSDYRDVTNSAV